MELLDGLYNNYLRFLSWEELSFISTGTGALVMLNLVLSEGILSFDNALVLATVALATIRFFPVCLAHPLFIYAEIECF